MKLRYIWIFVFVAVIILSFIILFQTTKNIREEILQYFQAQQQEDEEKTQTTTTLQQQKLNQKNESNYSTQPPFTPPSGITSEETKTEKALTLELVDICSGKLDLFIISEGATSCLNKKPPYYVIIEKNSTHLKISLQNEDFTEFYEINSKTPIFFIFAEDVASVSHEIQSFSLEGNPEFYLGEYYLHKIWERDSSGSLTISKMIVALSLYANNNITAEDEWKELRFYLNTPNKTYYLGNLWVLVKEK